MSGILFRIRGGTAAEKAIGVASIFHAVMQCIFPLKVDDLFSYHPRYAGS